jgi:hypothetical protein
MPFGTGPNDPWYYNKYFQIGPFTGSDQSNAAANAQRTQLLQGIGALPGVAIPRTAGNAPGSHTLQQTYGDPVAAALDTAAMQPGVTPFPSVTIPTTPAQRAQNGQSAPIINPAPRPASHYGLLPDVPDTVYLGGTEARPSNVPDSSPVVPNPQAVPVQYDPTLPDTAPVPYDPSAVPLPPSAGSTAAVPSATSPDGIASDSLEFATKLAKALGYPEAPSVSNPKQDAADAYAAHEMDRTRLLAQLAFASGMTAGSGGAWEGIGQGFAAAANTYDKGFNRYQKALDNSANRYADQQKEQYAYQAKRAATLGDLYSASENQKLAHEKIVRDYAKDRQDTIDKMFQKEIDSQKNEMVIPDPRALENTMKRWQLSRQKGEYIPAITDVTR